MNFIFTVTKAYFVSQFRRWFDARCESQMCEGKKTNEKRQSWYNKTDRCATTSTSTQKFISCEHYLSNFISFRRRSCSNMTPDCEVRLLFGRPSSPASGRERAMTNGQFAWTRIGAAKSETILISAFVHEILIKLAHFGRRRYLHSQRLPRVYQSVRVDRIQLLLSRSAAPLSRGMCARRSLSFMRAHSERIYHTRTRKGIYRRK